MNQGPAPSRKGLAWLVVALFGGLLYLGLDSKHAPEAVALTLPVPEAPAEGAGVVLEPVVALRSAAPATFDVDPQAVPTAREFLAQYYGARWPEIEPKIKARALDEPYHFTPWESVAAEFASKAGLLPEHRAAMIQAKLHWVEPLDAGWLHDQFGIAGWDGTLDESELFAIEALVEPLHEEILALAEQFADRTEAYLQEMWQRGTYLRAPFTTMGLSDRMGFHSQSIGGHCWALTFTLTTEDCPDIQPLEDELQAARDRRDLLVIGYLRDRLRR